MDAKEYPERGGKYFNEKNFDMAIADFTEVIQLESDNPFAYYKRGLSYANKNEFDMAIADFTEAIRLEPNKFGDFYFDRSGAYVFKGENALAISDLEMAVKIDPQKESYCEALEDLKNGKIPSITEVSSATINFNKFFMIIIVGGVIGGIVGLAGGAAGLFIGLFLGIGLGQFFADIKEELGVQMKVNREHFEKNVSESGIIKGFFFTLFIFVLYILFRSIWVLIKSPFVTIYRLLTKDFRFGW